MNGLVRSAVFASLLVTLAASAQDVLSVASTSANAGSTASVAVYLQDVSGTPLGYDAAVGKRIQGIAFRVTYDPALVSSVTFVRAGALQNLNPLYERTTNTTGAIGYLGAFAESTQPVPLSITALSGARIGTLRVQLAPSIANGTTVALTLDPAIATLSNQAATLFENRYNRKLTLINGSIVIGGATTTTSIGSSANPSSTGQSVTFTANVSSATPGTIDGTMTFYDGASPIGFTQVSGGQATFATSALSGGTHSISAVYEGNPTYLPSASSAVSQSVNHNLDAPAALNAYALSTTSAYLSWSAVGNATSYEIRRRSNNGSYVFAGATSNTTFTDNNLTPNTTYLYVVYAINGGYSPPSTPDPVTTIMFTDDPLIASATGVKATHFDELRAAINAFRATAGLPPLTFTDPSLAGQKIRTSHLQELRSAISTVRSILGLSTPAFTDPTLTSNTSIIRAVHLEDLRNAVK